MNRRALSLVLDKGNLIAVSIIMLSMIFCVIVNGRVSACLALVSCLVSVVYIVARCFIICRRQIPDRIMSLTLKGGETFFDEVLFFAELLSGILFILIACAIVVHNFYRLMICQ